MCEYVLRALIQENISKYVYWVSYVRWNVTYGSVGVWSSQRRIERNKCTQLEISYVSCHMLPKNNGNKVQTAIVGICRQRLEERLFFCLSLSEDFLRGTCHLGSTNEKSFLACSIIQFSSVCPPCCFAVKEHTIKAVWTCLHHVSHWPSYQKQYTVIFEYLVCSWHVI